jgi:hypothetical protein
MSEATPQPRYVTVEELIRFLRVQETGVVKYDDGSSVYAAVPEMFTACQNGMHMLRQARDAYHAIAAAMLRGMTPSTPDHGWTVEATHTECSGCKWEKEGIGRPPGPPDPPRPTDHPDPVA